MITIACLIHGLVAFILNRYTDKSDIFSFGVILSVLLTGRDPRERALSNREDGSGSGGSVGRWLEESVEPRELPEDRPCSDELLVMLTQLQSF